MLSAMPGTATSFIATLLATGAVWLAPAGEAAAAPGQLIYEGCLANNAGDGCADLAGTPLTRAQGVAVSGDGRSVYVASSGSDSLAHFSRTGTRGQLAYGGCLGNDAQTGCGDLPAAPIDGAVNVAVSPDGRSVYAVASGGHTIAHFFRGSDGHVAWDGCLGSDGLQGCGDLFARPLDGASGVTVSPDGQSVYVASAGNNSIEHFLRTGLQGQITYDGCLETQPGCVVTTHPLSSPSDVAVSPDGRFVYVASVASGSIAHYVRGSNGRLAYESCVANDALPGCADLPGTPLDLPFGLALSPDGRSLYAVSAQGNSIAHLRAGDTGRLGYEGCLANTAVSGCDDLPGAPLGGAAGVEVSPDGASVYVASSSSDSIAHFFRAPDGRLTYDGCLANSNTQGCADLPFAPLAGANGVAVSPDGSSVYVTSAGSDSIAQFFREPGEPPASPPGSGTAPGVPPGGGIRFGARTRVTLALATRRIRARGPVPIVVRNANAFAVRGRLSGERVARPGQRSVRLPAKRFRVAAGQRTTLNLRVPAALRRELVRTGRLRLRLTASLRDPAGDARTVNRTLTPRLRRARTATRAGGSASGAARGGPAASSR
jgi:DNA-binding beta-propeller fold protein YncE